MANVLDVAAYVLDQMGEMTALKLQKLAYYCQAWHLAWAEKELFPEQFEAWAGGPVSPTLYDRHRGMFRVARGILPDANPDVLTAEERDTVARVIDFYGPHSAQWLSDLTHLEQPWIAARARAGAGPGAFCRETVTVADMAEYYSGLMADDTSQATT